MLIVTLLVECITAMINDVFMMSFRLSTAAKHSSVGGHVLPKR